MKRLLTPIIATVLLSCHHGGAGEHPSLADSCPQCSVLSQFYADVVLGTAPQQRVLEALCTERMKHHLVEAQQAEARRYGDEGCDHCMTIVPFIAPCLDSLPTLSDTCRVISVTQTDSTHFEVAFIYYGNQRKATITFADSRIDGVEVR